MIGVLDMNAGNIRSVFNSVYSLGFDPIVVDSKKYFDDITHLILPGVGSFPAAVNYLKKTDFFTSIINFKNSGRPLLGICLGMQLFTNQSSEIVETAGLNFIPGEVRKLPASNRYRVPHIGWNMVHFENNHPVFSNIKNGRDFYFVHSYYFQCEREDNIAAITEYDCSFPSVVFDANVRLAVYGLLLE